MALKGSGRSCGVGCARIGAFPKRNSRCTWVSSSSCTTCASGVKRCFLRSLSCWSHKTLESNMSDEGYHGQRTFPQTQPAWTRRSRRGAHENPKAIIRRSAHHLSTGTADLPPLRRPLGAVELPCLG